MMGGFSDQLQKDNNDAHRSSESRPGEMVPASMIDDEELAKKLGSYAFRKDYKIKYAYMAGAMYRGISSAPFVVALGKAGLMGSLGTGGMRLDEIQDNIDCIQRSLAKEQGYSLNLVCNLSNPRMEMKTVELYLKKRIQRMDAAAFLNITPALALYRLKGLRQNPDGSIDADHKILAKVSRPEVAEAFMSPAPESLVSKLLLEGKITRAQAQMAKEIPMSSDICVEADSGGHTDQGVASVLLPAIQKLGKEIMRRYRYVQKPRIGLAGGIGTPEAAAAAFTMGADFIITGSINQCTVEAGASNAVKDLLQGMNIQDTDYAPAGDMFELGAKVQVLKKGTLFPARSNKLFMLYKHYNSLEEIPENIKNQLQNKFFKKSFDDIWEETKAYYHEIGQQQEIEMAERSPKFKMALIFRWYFHYSARLALSGDLNGRSDYQVHTGPALGAFNQWVKGTRLESWKARHVDQIAEKLMKETAVVLSKKLQMLLKKEP